jgi:putative phosphoribosyl transferase
MNTALSPLHEWEVRIPCSRVTLEGEAAVPVGARGLVVVLPDGGATRRGALSLEVAAELHRKRIATLMFDPLTSEEVRCERDTAELRYNVSFLADRLAYAARWAMEETALRNLGVGYLGIGTGAGGALLAASDNPDIQAVVCIAGRTDLAGDAVARVTAPTLLVAGGLDHPLIHRNRAAFQRLAGIKHMVLLAGAGSTLREAGAATHAATAAADWFDLYLSHYSPPSS